jgi:hypothetical protein
MTTFKKLRDLHNSMSVMGEDITELKQRVKELEDLVALISNTRPTTGTVFSMIESAVTIQEIENERSR